MSKLTKITVLVGLCSIILFIINHQRAKQVPVVVPTPVVVPAPAQPIPVSPVEKPAKPKPKSVEKISLPAKVNTWIHHKIASIRAKTNINPTVLKTSLIAYANAQEKGIVQKPLLTIIDYTKPSNEKRLWVVNLHNDQILFNTLVSHGKNSGQHVATSFSNKPGSLQSSLGVFVTEDTYMGGNGYSLRIDGLERGINDKALSRSIVFHGASYVNPSMAKERGMVGRSWGCPAVQQHLAKPLIDTIKHKTLVVVYYPDQHWLKHSAFLT